MPTNPAAHENYEVHRLQDTNRNTSGVPGTSQEHIRNMSAALESTESEGEDTVQEHLQPAYKDFQGTECCTFPLKRKRL